MPDGNCLAVPSRQVLTHKNALFGWGFIVFCKKKNLKNSSPSVKKSESINMQILVWSALFKGFSEHVHWSFLVFKLFSFPLMWELRFTTQHYILSTDFINLPFPHFSCTSTVSKSKKYLKGVFLVLDNFTYSWKPVDILGRHYC